MGKEYLEDVRKSFRRMETGEILERLNIGNLTETARQIANDELASRDLDPITQSIATPDQTPSSPKNKRDPIFIILAIGGFVGLIAMFLNPSAVPDSYAKGASIGLALGFLLIFFLLTNSGLNFIRKRKGKPARSIMDDASTILLLSGIALVAYVWLGVYLSK